MGGASAEKKEQVKEIFAQYDADGNGSISFRELGDVLKAIGRFSTPEVKKIFSRMDKNQDGNIQYKEFVDWVFASGRKADAKAKTAIMDSDDKIKMTFFNFCVAGTAELDGKSFTKLLKDANLIDKSFTSTDTDIIFAKCVAKGTRRMTFEQFERSIMLVAEGRGEPHNNIRRAIESCGGPQIKGTETEAVRFHDDKSLYTGAHREGSAPRQLERRGTGPVLMKYEFNDRVDRTFADFCDKGNTMDGKGFAKLCKDCGLLDKDFTAGNADLVFTTVMGKARRMSAEQFHEALLHIAARTQHHPKEIEQAVMNCSGPSLQCTRTDSVRFHDDKSTYTGMHAA